MNRREFLKASAAAAVLAALPKFGNAKEGKLKILVLTGSEKNKIRGRIAVCNPNERERQ